MKRMKKLASLVLAVVMALAMTMTVSAADSYTITIKNEATGHIYEAYQIFKGDLSEDKKILSNVEWGSGVNDTELLTALQKTTDFAGVTSAADVVAKLDGEEKDSDLAKSFASIVADYLVEANAKTSTYSTTDKEYTISGLEAGYYLVKDQKVTGHDSYTRFILKVVGDVEVAHKGTVPTVDKEIVDGETSETGDYNISDNVTFKLTGTLPENYDDYSSYKYVFHDTLSAGLAFNEGTVKVILVNDDEEKNITEYFGINHNNGTLTITCGDLKEITDVTADSSIVVTYTAKVDKDAVIGGEGNPNTVYLEFSNDPNYDGNGENEPTGNTPEDKVVVFTFELDVTKVDGEDKATTLEGAQFKLQNADGKWVKVDANGKVDGWDENKENGSPLTSDEDGNFKIIGLEDGEYKLWETKAPDGYNLLEKEITLTITSTYDESGVKTLTITVGESTAVGNTSTGVVSTNVENNKGATLPETGGMGTTLFYIVGGALVLIAVVVLITKKRMSAEK